MAPPPTREWHQRPGSHSFAHNSKLDHAITAALAPGTSEPNSPSKRNNLHDNQPGKRPVFGGEATLILVLLRRGPVVARTARVGC
jgi:hypothetical protein